MNKDYKKIEWSIWKDLLGVMLNKKKYIIGLVLTMLLTAAIDVVFPLLSTYVIDDIVPSGSLDGFGRFLALYAVLAAAQGFNVFLFIVFGSRIELGMAYDMRRDMFRRLQELELAFYDNMPTGQIVSRMLSDVSRLSEMMAWGLVDGSWAIAYMIGVVIAMLILNLPLALTVVFSVPPIVLLSIYFQKRILKAQRESRKINATITSAFNEGIMGARTTKTLLFENANLNEFKGRTGAMKKASLRAAKYSAIYLPLVVLIGNACMGAVLWPGGSKVMAGTLTLGVLSAFVTYATGFFEPVNNLAGIFAEMQSAQAAAERVTELLHKEIGITDTPEVESVFGTVFEPKRENWHEMKGHVVFDNVTFEYKENAPVLSNFSLDAKPGMQIALVGATGAGKTTISQLLGRFYEPKSGTISIDGTDTRKLGIPYLESKIGYVLQTPHLFSGNVRDNIRYGRPDATGDEVERAAKIASAHDFIMKLQNGYDTEVGEGGNLLSTGQKQLIAFARAVLIDPAIFVLDEATASIDTKTEQLIQKAIEKVLSGRTSFVIAHRLSTIRKADLIVVINDGRETERGTHSELMKKRGEYYHLYTNQFEEQAERSLVGKALVEE